MSLIKKLGEGIKNFFYFSKQNEEKQGTQISPYNRVVSVGPRLAKIMGPLRKADEENQMAYDVINRSRGNTYHVKTLEELKGLGAYLKRHSIVDGEKDVKIKISSKLIYKLFDYNPKEKDDGLVFAKDLLVKMVKPVDEDTTRYN